MSVQITNGSVKYGETRKIADFENKIAHVELSFSIPEGTDADEAIKSVSRMAKLKFQELVGQKPPEAIVSDALKQPEQYRKPAYQVAAEVVEKALEEKHPAKPVAKKAPKMPEQVAEKAPVIAADPAEIVEPVAEAVADFVAEAVTELEKQETLLEPVITDAELMDAVSSCQQRTKNSLAIRKLLNECGVKHPPGRVPDLPQDMRQKYLDGLKEIKPLA